MNKNGRNRILALVLSLCLMLSMFPLSGIPALAAEGCTHEHDPAICGYIAEVEGAPCTFQHTPHDEPCGYAEAVEAAPCSVEAEHIVHDAACGGDPDSGEGCTFAHTPHDDACGWAEAKEAVSCAAEAAHTHDTTVCGYIEAVAGHPCGHTCDESCGGLTLGGSPDFVPQNLDSGVRAIPAMNPEAVGFAGKEWWVIGKDGTGVNSGDKTMTLLSKENLIADGAFGSNNQYGGSLLKKAMENYYANMSFAQERALIQPRELDDVRLSDGADGILFGDHFVWPLSYNEANSLSTTIRTNGFNWWLRSAYPYNIRSAGAVYYDGDVDYNYVFNDWGGRPAMTLDLNSVLFTSDAAGGKPAVGGELQPYTEPTTGTVKLTVKDDVNLKLMVSALGDLTIPEGGTVSFNYMDAATGAGRSVSVMIQDKDTGGILYYGRPVDCSTAPSTTVNPFSLKLPDGLTAGTYTLLIFNEQVNGANETDFASTPHKYDLKVEAKTTPGGPGVANGDTVHFAGNEWYVIGKDGAGVNPKNKTMTLLSKENLFTTKFHDSSNEYGASTLHEKMKEYYNGLSAENQALIQPRTLDGVRLSDGTDGTLPGDHFVWPLSKVEAESLSTTIRANGSGWWLRSPGSGSAVGAVYAYGNIYNSITLVYGSLGGRPAMTLDLNSAIFASASAGEGGGIAPSGKVVVPKNGSQTFTIKANAGYQVDQVLLDGAPVSLTGDSYTLTGAAANCTIEASFVPESASITLPGLRYEGKVGFAGKEWYVVGLNEENDQVNPRNGAMTLLSVENLIAEEAFGSDSQYGSSDLKGRMEAFYNGSASPFLAQERALIQPRTLDGMKYDPTTGTSSDTLPGDHFVWPLSRVEAESLPSAIRANGSWWWLRSASSNSVSLAGAVNNIGTVIWFTVSSSGGGRPAMTLDLKSVLFTSDALGGDKSNAGLGVGNTTALSTTGTVKLTVVDDANLSLDVTTTGPITAKENGVASFAYENAKTGAGRSVSVLIQDKTTGGILYYSRPGNCETSGDGTASFQLPNGLTEGTYTLLIFNEQVNSKNVTDFASTPKSMDLKVERKTGNASQVVVGGTDVSGGGYWKNDGSGGLAACGQAEIGAGAWNVLYEAATATLTLKDAAIGKGHTYTTQGGKTAISGIYADGGLTLCLEGNSAVGGPALDNPGSEGSYGVRVEGNLTVTGSGALVSKGGTADGWSAGVAVDYGGITMQGGTLTGTGSLVTDDIGVSYGVYAGNATIMAGSTLTGTGGAATGTNGYSIGIVFAGLSSLAGGKMTGTGGAATGANGSSYGINIGIANINNFYVKGGEVIAQSKGGGHTAQAYAFAPAIDPAYAAARLWYGADAAAALAQGPKAPGDADADWWKQAYARIADPNPSGSNGGGNNSGNSSDDNDDSPSRRYTTTSQPPKPDNPVLAVIELPVAVGDGTATGAADDGRTAAALADAAKKPQAKVGGIAVRYDAKTSLTYDGFAITIKRATLDRLTAAKVKYVTLNTGIVDLTFDLAALREIQKQTTGDITLTATRETGLTGDALAAVGSRPAYRLSVSYTGKDGRAATVQSFGAGKVTVGLAYAAAATEQAGSLCLVYSADGKGAQWLYQSSYDKNSGNVIASVGHFSVYAVGYRPAPAFTDTVNHWAREDIDFVASRGLLTGTGKTTFSPDGAVTRGAFAAALEALTGRAAGGLTDPDAPLTREQMALTIRQHADKLGYALPVAREAESFADDSKIGNSTYRKAIQAMQQAGIMNGKGGHRFGPKDTATRAEAAAVLRRFAEIVIDRATAGGWGQNDAGKWLYYENAKPVTGWKQIDSKWYYFDSSGLMQAGGWKQVGGKWYYFYPDGAMAANTKIDGYEIGPDGKRKEK